METMEFDERDYVETEQRLNVLNHLKAKYGDMEFVLVDDDHIQTAKEQASNMESDKDMFVLISESELEEMAVNEETRTKNEKINDIFKR